jgi:hypothetical protein
MKVIIEPEGFMLLTALDVSLAVTGYNSRPAPYGIPHVKPREVVVGSFPIAPRRRCQSRE